MPQKLAEIRILKLAEALWKLKDNQVLSMVRRKSILEVIRSLLIAQPSVHVYEKQIRVNIVW